MGVVGDVAPGQFSYPHAEVLLEDLGRRRRLLLADADEALDAALELRCGRVVSPVGTGVAALLVEHLHGREVEPIRHRVDQSVERRRTGERPAKRVRCSRDLLGVEVPEPPSQLRTGPPPSRG
jgi:hypothetical protein